MKNYLKKSFVRIAVAIMAFNAVFMFAGVGFDGENRYSGYGEEDGIMPYATEISREIITYTSKEEEYIETTNGVPLYMQTGTMQNGCGAIGGAIIVGFYDKYYENLIPGYTPHLSSGKYKGSDSTYVPQLMWDLYALMRTNVDDVGVSQADCVNGLKAYVQNKGYSIQMTNIRSNNKVNEAAFVNAINNNRPTLLFCDRTDIYGIGVSAEGNLDQVVGTNFTTGGHIVVAYGFYTVKYYNGSTLFRTDKYINVATGLSTFKNSFMRIEDATWCNGAYAVAVS